VSLCFSGEKHKTNCTLLKVCQLSSSSWDVLLVSLQLVESNRVRSLLVTGCTSADADRPEHKPQTAVLMLLTDAADLAPRFLAGHGK
jgi:hypothetical protein